MSIHPLHHALSPQAPANHPLCMRLRCRVPKSNAPPCLLATWDLTPLLSSPFFSFFCLSLTYLSMLIYSAVLGLGCSVWDLVPHPHQGLNLGLSHEKHSILATGPPGKSPTVLLRFHSDPKGNPLLCVSPVFLIVRQHCFTSDTSGVGSPHFKQSCDTSWVSCI